MARAKTPTDTEPDAAQPDDSPVVTVGDASALPPPEPQVFDSPGPQPLAETPDPVQLAKRPRARGAGFAALAVGGAVAAGVGFLLAQAVPNGWPTASTALLESRLEAQEQEIAVLKTALSERPAPDLSPVSDSLDALQAQVTALEQAVAALPPPAEAPDLTALTDRLDSLEARETPAVDLSALEGRLAALEALPQGAATADPAATAQLGRDLADIRAELARQKELAASATESVTAAAAAARSALVAAQEEARTALAEARAEALRIKEEAQAAVADTRRDAALGRLSAAVEGGAPFAGAASELNEAGMALPEVLTSQAEVGVPTLLSLQTAFPDAARAALEASLMADMGDTTMERIGTFLRTQTGARSLEAREGTDPDAVLSRAAAAVSGGDLAGALAEIGALPEPGQAALADWATRAQARVDAQAAVAALATAP